MKAKRTSPFKHRYVGSGHENLSETAHNAAHSGEKPTFSTIEQENRFRDFVWKSNPKFAKDIDLDKTNITKGGTLNNPTIQLAYEHLGGLYQDFLGKVDIFETKQQKVSKIESGKGILQHGKATATVESRYKTKPTGVNPRSGNVFYMNYDEYWNFGQEHGSFGGIHIPLRNVPNLGSRDNESSADKFVDNFKNMIRSSDLVWKSGESWREHFHIENISSSVMGIENEDRIKITRNIDGAELEIELNTDSSRTRVGIGNNLDYDDLLSWEDTNLLVWEFVNGFKQPSVANQRFNYGKSLGTPYEMVEDYKNPFNVLLNTYADRRVVKTKDQYEQILFGDYKANIQNIGGPKTKEEKREEAVNIHAGNPILKNLSEWDQDLIENVEYKDGVWQASFPGVPGPELEGALTIPITDPIIITELNWSQKFPTLKKLNDGKIVDGMYDLFLDGATNYWEADQSISDFFNLSEWDAMSRLKEILPSEFTISTVPGKMKMKEGRNWVRIEYTDDNGDVQSHDLNIVGGKYGLGLKNQWAFKGDAQEELIKLHNFLWPVLKEIHHTNNGALSERRWLR